MNKETLLNSARKIKSVSEDTRAEYLDKIEQLIADSITQMSEYENINELVGDRNERMMKDNISNHVKFISSLLSHYEPDVFVETVLWVFRAYRSHGFRSNYWAVQLNVWLCVLQKQLTKKSFEQIKPYYDWMIINIPIFVLLSDQQLNKIE